MTQVVKPYHHSHGLLINTPNFHAEKPMLSKLPSTGAAVAQRIEQLYDAGQAVSSTLTSRMTLG